MISVHGLFFLHFMEQLSPSIFCCDDNMKMAREETEGKCARVHSGEDEKEVREGYRENQTETACI